MCGRYSLPQDLHGDLDHWSAHHYNNGPPEWLLSRITLADCEPYTDAQLVGTNMDAECSWEWQEATLPVDPDVPARVGRSNLDYVRNLCLPPDYDHQGNRYTTEVGMDEWLYPATPQELAYWRLLAHRERTLKPIRQSKGMLEDEAYLRAATNAFVEASSSACVSL